MTKFDEEYAVKVADFLNGFPNMFQDIRYGEMFSKDFSDSREDKNTDEGLVNLHNNEAGRRVSFITSVLM